MRVFCWLSLMLLVAAPCRAERVVFALRSAGLSPPSFMGGTLRRFDLDLPPAPKAAALPSPVTPWRLGRALIYSLELPDSATAKATVASLAADPRVAWAERDLPREPCVWLGDRDATPVPIGAAATTTSLDPLLDDGRQWGLDNLGEGGPYGGTGHADIHARAAWGYSRGDPNVVLAVTDSGVDPWHPELATALTDGFDATLVPGESFADSIGHGTQVAGIIAARTGEGAHFDSLGIAGVCGGDGARAAGCRLMPVRISTGHSSSVFTFDEARGIAWAVDHGARVINLSVAATSPSIVERHAILDALARGVLVVCAAGNRALDRPGLPMYPAALAGDGLCMSVGASDAWDRRASWSSYGAWLDLVAPGVDIWSTALTYPDPFGGPPRRYAANAGTSFAAPFATGVAGLMLAMRPELDAGDLAPLMCANADDIGAPGPDSLTGAGRLDAARVLAALTPDHAIVHGFATPRVVEVTHDTLTLGEGGQPVLDALGRTALVARLTLLAAAPVPDSLDRPVAAWTRVAHSTTLRVARTLAWPAPWAEVVAVDADSITMRGTVYRIEDPRVASLGAIDTMTRWLPVPPESARIAYTIHGRVRPRAAVVEPEARAMTPMPRLVATPSPFTRLTRLRGPAGATIELFDVRGRRVRTLRLDAGGVAEWDGHDEHGRDAPCGLYLMRGRDGTCGRMVKLE